MLFLRDALVRTPAREGARSQPDRGRRVREFARPQGRERSRRSRWASADRNVRSVGSNVGDERRAKACAARFRTSARSTGWATARRGRVLRAFADGSQTGLRRKPTARTRATDDRPAWQSQVFEQRRNLRCSDPDRPPAGRRRTDSPACLEWAMDCVTLALNLFRATPMRREASAFNLSATSRR